MASNVIAPALDVDLARRLLHDMMLIRRFEDLDAIRKVCNVHVS